MRRGCDRHEPPSLEPDLHPFADSYPKQPKHTIVLKSGTVYTPRGTTRSAQTEPKANAVGKIPSVEEVMAKWGCDRETAQGYIDENMY